MSTRGLNLLVFRDGRRQVNGAALRRGLLAQLNRFSEASPVDVRMGALLRSGGLECAVADSDAFVPPFSKLTDVVAEALLSGQLSDCFQSTKKALATAPMPEEMTVSTPEGFAYYALHPLSYAQVLGLDKDKLPAL